jgi:adenylate cyclase
VKSFFELIDRMNCAGGAERAELERQLAATYRCDKAVLALDMSGFSLSVRRSGIVSYLCCIRRMQQSMQPILPEFRGHLVKCEADNLLAVFDEARHAVAAARAMVKAAEEIEIGVGIGLDYGPVLLIPGQDCFGDAVNIAYKLGEDVARRGEILLTKALRETLDPAEALEALELSIGGLQVDAYRVPHASRAP